MAVAADEWGVGQACDGERPYEEAVDGWLLVALLLWTLLLGALLLWAWSLLPAALLQAYWLP